MDLLQPVDISVNKRAKDYHKADDYNEWYSQAVIKQSERRELEDLRDIDIQHIDLSMHVVKEVSARRCIHDDDKQLWSGTFDTNVDDVPEEDYCESEEDISNDEKLTFLHQLYSKIKRLAEIFTFHIMF